MATTGLSLLTDGLTFLSGDVTSRKRKQSSGDQDSASPARRGSRLRWQESGSSASLLTTLADPRRQTLDFGQFYHQTDETSALCASAEDRSCDDARGLFSAPSQQPFGADRRLQAVPGMVPPPEGRMFDRFRPFSSHGQEGAQLDVGCLQDDGRQSLRNSWQRNNHGLQRPGLDLENESGGRSSGASGITRQGDVRSGGSTAFDGRRNSGQKRWSQEFRARNKSVSVAGSGLLSGITREEASGWGNSEDQEAVDGRGDDADVQSTGQHQEKCRRSEATGNNCELASPQRNMLLMHRAPGLLHSNVGSPALALAPAMPNLREKRGRREFEDGDERDGKCIRLDGVKAELQRGGPAPARDTLSPDSVLTGALHLSPSCNDGDGRKGGDLASASRLSYGVHDGVSGVLARDVGRDPERREGASAAGEGHVGTGAEVDRWRMRDNDQQAGARERLSDSHPDYADVESSGRLSGYDPDTSVSDVPDGGGTFILSSGRSRHRKGSGVASRQPTIDDEFEQYFAQMLL